MAQQRTYGVLTPKMMVQLSAPHTWVAAVLPVVCGAAVAVSRVGYFDQVLFVCMLVICILMQSAVNTLNDYVDYAKGADTLENQLDPTDAVLVYNNVDPRHALYLFFAQMVLALAIGIYVIIRSSWICLVIGVIAAVVLVIYSAGKTPLSYLPLGELASGFTMGGLIMLATAYVMSGTFDWLYLLYSLPLILGIGLINCTNNMCDIEKDIEANRHTLPVLLGRQNGKTFYRLCMVVIVASIIVLIAVYHVQAWPMLIAMLCMVYPLFKALWANPLILKSRGAAMSQVLCFNICLGAFYAVCWFIP